MPAKVERRGNKYRVVEAETGRLVRNRRGTPVDGGGHATLKKAREQAAAINISQRRKRS